LPITPTSCSFTESTTSSQTAHASGTSIGLSPGLSGRFTAFGKTDASQSGNGTSSTAVTSLISANTGSLSMNAGTDAQYKGTGQGNIVTQGADLLAKDSVRLSGNAVDLQAATSSSTDQFHSQSKSVTLGAQMSGMVGGAITAIGDNIDTARHSDHSDGHRLKGAAALKAGYDAYKLVGSAGSTMAAANAAATPNGDPGSAAFAVSVSLGTSKSSQDQRQTATSQQGTNIQANTPVTGSVSMAKEQIAHDYQSAKGQSGIAAGDGGYQIAVKGNTDLKGGAITSSAGADKNSLTTSSLTFSDLQNQQSTDVSSQSFSAGYGGASMAGTLISNVAQNVVGNLVGGAGLPESGSQQGVTQSVISPGAVKITGADTQSQEAVATLTSRDASKANGALTNALTLQQAQGLDGQRKTAQENLRAAQMVGAVMDNAIGDLAVKHQWAEGSTEKTLLHGLSGVVQASIGNTSALAGMAAGAVNEQLVGVMGNYLESQGIHERNPDGSRNVAFADLMQAGSALVGAGVESKGRDGLPTAQRIACRSSCYAHPGRCLDGGR
jgi:filamentous hemagglutinin